ncbi:unnamed protein product [Dicrocoelium dendriticum]|nr:unnamed protein product [Dicrocoelium dendriticum]
MFRTLLLACCFLWTAASDMAAPAFHRGLTLNADIITCQGHNVTLTCRHRIAGLDANVTMYWIPEGFVPNGTLITGPIPGIPSSELLSRLGTNGKLVANGKFRHVKSGENEYSEFTLNLESIRQSDAGVYICAANADLLLALRYTKVSVLSTCNRVGRPPWYLGVVTFAAVLLICMTVFFCHKWHVKNSKPRTLRLISLSHPECTNSTSDPGPDNDSGISQCSRYHDDYPKAVAIPHVQFEQVSIPSGIGSQLLRLVTRSTKHLRIRALANVSMLSHGHAQEASQATRLLHHLDTRFASIYRVQPDANYEIPRENLKVGSYLGGGAFGVVHLGTALDLPNHPSGQVVVAVKTLRDNFSESDVIDLLKEMDIMKQLHSHKHIIRLLAVCTQNGAPYLIMEYAPYGNLRSYLCANKSTFEQSASIVCLLLNYGRQVAEGMEFLSSRSIIHRDLAARNILVGEDYVLKIADFGLTRAADDYYRKLTNGRLPIKWLAPECIFDRVYTVRSDVWSFGVLLWEVFSLGDSPFKGIDPAAVPRMIREGRRNPKPRFATESIYKIMQHCWEAEPRKRPSFVQLVASLSALECEHINLFRGSGSSSVAKHVKKQCTADPHIGGSVLCDVNLDSSLAYSLRTAYTKLVADQPLVLSVEGANSDAFVSDVRKLMLA